MHLIQELGGVDTGYRFSFYTYGPYSGSLAGDLDVVSKSVGAKISYESSNNRYLIEPDEHTDRMIEKGQAFIEGNMAAIERVLEVFGGRLAKDLELVSTIAYLRRHAPHEEFENGEALAKRVIALKPKYSNSQVRRGNCRSERVPVQLDG